MIAFWIVAALVTLAALAALIWPTLRPARIDPSRAEYDLAVYRDQFKEVDMEEGRGLLTGPEAKAARTEIQRRMLRIAEHDSGTVATGRQNNPLIVPGLALMGVLGAVALYAALGTPGGADHPYAARPQIAVAEETPAAHGPDGPVASINDMLGSLAERLAQNPNDARGWFLLGRSLRALGRMDEAVAALAKALPLSDRHPAVVLEYAEALVVANDNTVIHEARENFEVVVAADPTNHRARYFLGLERAQKGDLRGAAQHWVDLLAMSPSGEPWRQKVRDQVDMAAAEGGFDLESVTPSAEALALAAKVDTSAVVATGPTQTDLERAANMSPEERTAFIRSMVDGLASRLEQNPDDRDGWARLARAYENLGETRLAAEARAKAQSPSPRP